MWFANFAMRNFAKLLAVGLRNAQCMWLANFAMRNWLRIAQYPAATVPLVLHPAASHPASTASHFLHFSFVFPLIYGLFDG